MKDLPIPLGNGMALSSDVNEAAQQLDHLRQGLATHEELCDAALKHYEEISTAACHWNSTVVRALRFYKEHGPLPVYRSHTSEDNR